jgi:hypothetical protein
LTYAAKKAFTECSFLRDKNRFLFTQNNEKVTRKSVKSTVVGTAKVISYKNIVEARTNRNVKMASRISKRTKSAPKTDKAKDPRPREMEKAEKEIRNLGLTNYYSVLHFN